jgi:hypothetical protein
MAKMTNLEMVNDILSDMDAEEIAAIGDTVESNQVFAVMKSTFDGMVAKRDIPEHKGLFELTETDANSPSVMTLPANVIEMDWVQMDVRTDETAGVARRYTEIDYVEPEEFILRTRNRNDTDTTVDILDITVYTGDTEVMIRNDRAPSMYTSFDDASIMFDAYNVALDTFIPSLKTQCWGTLEPTWVATDGGTQDMDLDLFPKFLSISKNRSNAVVKSASNPNEERWERKLTISAQATQHRARKLVRPTDFGRIGSRTRPSVLSNRSNS